MQQWNTHLVILEEVFFVETDQKHEKIKCYFKNLKQLLFLNNGFI